MSPEYYPVGDPGNVDGDSEYPGSLYSTGHQTRNYGWIAEISVPRPVKSKNPADLPRAKTITDFRYVKPANAPPSRFPVPRG